MPVIRIERSIRYSEEGIKMETIIDPCDAIDSHSLNSFQQIGEASFF
jgi:hypothetical protein